MAADLPLVSVVTPSFNHGQYLERTIRSVLFQDYPKIEYLVLDGGSTDASADILQRYASHLAYWRSEPDDGQAAALRDGFAIAKGDILAYLNSDDVFAPGAITTAVRYLQRHRNIDLVYSHRCFVDESDRVEHFWILPPHVNFLMERWDYIPQETAFWRRSIMERAGGIDPSYRFAMDYDLFVRFMRHGHLARLNCILGAFRRYAGQKTIRDWQSVGVPEIARVQHRYGIEIKPFEARMARTLDSLINSLGRLYPKLPFTLQGAPKTLGTDYDTLWAGVLKSSSLPPKRS